MATDITGYAFGQLTALRQITKYPAYFWECKCSCGCIVNVRRGKLTSGKTVSCGCKKKEPKVDIAGKVFGRLTAIKVVGECVDGRGFPWLCTCTCGAEKVVRYVDLKRKHVRSCGCIRREQLVERQTTHGETTTLTYRRWQAMHGRVRGAERPKNNCYAGITVCDEWSSYEQFKKDMGECPDGMSLDRIDNSKGYEPSNCRWVPLARQAANTSRNVFAEISGLAATISDHARANGIKPDVVFDRINKLGWSAEDAVSIPTMGVGKKRVKP